MDTTSGQPAGDPTREHGAGPVSPPEPALTPPPRLLLLDVLRGVAILGTLAMNIHSFDLSSGEGNQWVHDARIVLVSGSFYSLLALMFGVGLAVQFRSARASGRRWPGKQPWRAVLLLVEGTLHVVLVFALDVLMGYAVAALLVIWLLGRSQRVRTVVMWSAFAIHLALMAFTVVVQALLAPTPREGSASPPVDDHFSVLFRDGAYLDQVAYRLTNFLSTRGEVLSTLPMVVFLFLLGVRLYRAGVFDDDDAGRRIRDRMMAWGFGLGLPLNILASQVDPLGQAARYLFPIVLIFGYIGLAGWLLRWARPSGQIIRSLQAVGLTALTCYILQNVLASWLFYGWGAGLGQHLEERGIHGLTLDAYLFGAWLGVSVLLVAGSRLWLRNFRRGPIEAVGARLIDLVPQRSFRSPDRSKPNGHPPGHPT
ncbi:DUF418 domain-containing protein [Spiractinospora alimapuensis]|uniref:DUF418 domain-containing protein n=1 Tax=Spiractinospora alimapuensis TaxID=2820884 RepID=UPI001F3B7630|nr:DUF418 domain-containing protein [Spiractinospora alimapuensis]QVQ51878.1 DUF418 domain-containing protein [Spiractinospora alimapuensis]